VLPFSIIVRTVSFVIHSEENCPGGYSWGNVGHSGQSCGTKRRYGQRRLKGSADAAIRCYGCAAQMCQHPLADDYVTPYVIPESEKLSDVHMR